MTEQEEREFWEEVEHEETKFVFKCKPTWNFQSIEFEVTATGKEIPLVAELYKMVLEELIKISPEQAKGPSKQEPLATDKQKAIMEKFNLPYSSSTTAAEAQAAIKKSLEKTLR